MFGRETISDFRDAAQSMTAAGDRVSLLLDEAHATGPYLDNLAVSAGDTLHEVKTAAQTATLTLTIIGIVALLALGIATAALVRADR